jgi:hypothetical protein
MMHGPRIPADVNGWQRRSELPGHQANACRPRLAEEGVRQRAALAVLRTLLLDVSAEEDVARRRPRLAAAYKWWSRNRCTAHTPRGLLLLCEGAAIHCHGVHQQRDHLHPPRHGAQAATRASQRVRPDDRRSPGHKPCLPAPKGGRAKRRRRSARCASPRHWGPTWHVEHCQSRPCRQCQHRRSRHSCTAVLIRPAPPHASIRCSLLRVAIDNPALDSTQPASPESLCA